MYKAIIYTHLSTIKLQTDAKSLSWFLAGRYQIDG